METVKQINYLISREKRERKEGETQAADGRQRRRQRQQQDDDDDDEVEEGPEQDYWQSAPFLEGWPEKREGGGGREGEREAGE